MARLTKKTERQLVAATRTPPRAGPVAAAMPPAAPQSAVAVARCSSGNSGSSSASDVGTRIAAPAACTTRAATSTSTDGASPQTAEAARKVETPTKNIRRRPRRSDSRPAGTSSAAKTML